MTTFEALCYLQNKEAIWLLGRAGGYIEYTSQQIISGQAEDFISSLYDFLFDALKMNSSIKFEQTDTTKFRVFFEKGRDGIIIYLWVGERDPEAKILTSEYLTEMKTQIYTEKSAVQQTGSGWFYQMEQGAQFFMNGDDTFIVSINRYLKECSEQDHQALLSQKSFLRFWMVQDQFYLPPTVAGYLVPMEEIPAIHHEELKEASPELLLCELISPNGCGYYMRVKREKWSKKEVLTEDDIEMV